MGKRAAFTFFNIRVQFNFLKEVNHNINRSELHGFSSCFLKKYEGILDYTTEASDSVNLHESVLIFIIKICIVSHTYFIKRTT